MCALEFALLIPPERHRVAGTERAGEFVRAELQPAGVLRAAIKAGTGLYFVEDESADSLANIPHSVAYLKAFRNA
jgi:hypothetical protein